MRYPYFYSLIGLLYYPLQQALFYLRFGRFNTIVTSTDGLLALVGVLSFLIVFWFLNNAISSFARKTYWTTFIVLGIPLSLIGSVGGGLLGPLGVIIFGCVPVLVMLLLTKGVLMVLKK